MMMKTELIRIYDPAEDAEGVLTLLRPCAYGQRVQVGENIIIRFTDVGHLLGSACIETWLTEGDVEKKIVFSGDIGNTDQPIIRESAAPARSADRLGRRLCAHRVDLWRPQPR